MHSTAVSHAAPRRLDGLHSPASLPLPCLFDSIQGGKGFQLYVDGQLAAQAAGRLYTGSQRRSAGRLMNLLCAAGTSVPCSFPARWITIRVLSLLHSRSRRASPGPHCLSVVN